MTAALLTARDAVAARRRDPLFLLGIGVAAAGAAHVLALLWSPALAATLATAAATGLGALPILFARRISDRAQSGMLGFGAGVMLAAAAFSLFLPALDAGAALTGSRVLAGAMVALGLAAGGAVLAAMDRFVPHEHFIKGAGERGRPSELARIWLFVFAIALHNLPEGLAVGVGYGQPDAGKAAALALAIGVQNVPEGLVVAAALVAVGYSRSAAVLVALATGFVEPLGGLLGAGALAVSSALLPVALAFAGGAMLWVVSHEIIPESHRKGHERVATGGVLGGFAVMMLLDTLVV